MQNLQPILASFLTIFIVIASQVQEKRVKLKCPGVERFHSNGTLCKIHEEYGLTMVDGNETSAIHLAKDENWETVKEQWIFQNLPSH